ncbi:hypothetical protein [Arthrobacter sp. Leaf137]|uniref:hypothetical protein n=1 Tax=Arthrobacter sp. Leaf137 TaxID=1736271 RepID=UPI0006FA4327|nr:hypothetical protein [Arthrobacter sp. Leaf137]KQQ80988.1 hypothetical protein ASF64_13220 [Arthrobacter sp. Leaf137]
MTHVETQPSELDQEAAEDAPLDLETVAIGHYFARFGTFFLASFDEEDDDSIAAAHKAVLSSLRQDSRVQTLHSAPFRPHWSFCHPIYPSGRQATAERVLSGTDRVFALEFSDPLFIELRVPIKNQPVINGEADVPTDHYWVAWDGITAVVLWEAGPDEVIAPRSAGHILDDVLKTAAEDAGFLVLQQACSPECKNMFAHRDLRLIQIPGNRGIASGFVAGDDVGPASAIVERDGSAKDVLRSICGTALPASLEFAFFKNYARRLFAMEDLAHELVTDLLGQDYAAIVRKRRPLLKRALSRLLRKDKKRGERSVDELIASLWLLMASKDVLAGTVAAKRRSFHIQAADYETELLYVADRREDEHRLELLNLDFVRSAIEQKSSRLDNRIIAWATACGAFAAIIGAVIGRAWS